MHGFNHIFLSDIDLNITTRMKVNGICFIDNNSLNTFVTLDFPGKLRPEVIPGTENECPVILHGVYAKQQSPGSCRLSNWFCLVVGSSLRSLCFLRFSFFSLSDFGSLT